MRIGVQTIFPNRDAYALIRSVTNTIYNGSTFEAYLTANLNNYDVQADEQGDGSGFYDLEFPITTAGTYRVALFSRASLGADPAEGDDYLGSTEVVIGAVADSSTADSGNTTAQYEAQLSLIQARIVEVLASVEPNFTVGRVTFNTASYLEMLYRAQDMLIKRLTSIPQENIETVDTGQDEFGNDMAEFVGDPR